MGAGRSTVSIHFGCHLSSVTLFTTCPLAKSNHGHSNRELEINLRPPRTPQPIQTWSEFPVEVAQCVKFLENSQNHINPLETLQTGEIFATILPSLAPTWVHRTETWTPSDRWNPLQSMQTRTPRFTAASVQNRNWGRFICSNPSNFRFSWEKKL